MVMNKLFGVTQQCLKIWKRRKKKCNQASSHCKTSWILCARTIIWLLKYGMWIVHQNVLSEKGLSMKPYFRNVSERVLVCCYLQSSCSHYWQEWLHTPNPKPGCSRIYSTNIYISIRLLIQCIDEMMRALIANLLEKAGLNVFEVGCIGYGDWME